MADIFVYDTNTEDFDTLGLCGPLSPTKCVHVEEANGKSELTIEHPIDQEGRWAYLTEGRIVKAEVPVRTVPPITDAGDLVTSIEVWNIKSGVRPNLYYKAKGGKIRKKKLASGLQVRIVLKAENRYKAAFTGRKKVKKKWKTYVYYGWIDRNALEYVTVESIPADPEAIEQVAPAWKVTDQLFRIHATKLTDKGVTASARHIWYDLLGNVTTWTGLVGGANSPECLEALHGILDNCTMPHEFEGYTNIVGTRDTIEWTRISPVEALCDPETGLLARWGAELVRDNTEFYVLAEAGLNRGVRIEYAKNLLGVTCDVDMTDVVTRIQPVGQTAKGKPLLLAAGTYTVDGQSITIDATGTVVSPREGDHPTPHIMVLDVNDAKAAGTSAAQVRAARVKMIRAALAKFAEDADLPRVSLKVDFVALGDTEEYAQYQRLDDVFLYDRVRVWHPKIGVDVLTKANRIEFDCLLERFASVELGAVRRDWTRTQVATWQVPSGLPGIKFATGSVEARALADGSVTEDQIAPKAVVYDHLNDLTVDNLNAESITALTAKINEIVAGTITTDGLYAALADIIKLRVDQAVAGTVITDQLRAALASIANAQIGVANIDFAQIKDLVAGTAIITEGVGGQLYISRLSVNEANIVNLSVGQLLVKGDDGKFYRFSINEAGQPVTEEVPVENDNITDGTINGGKLVEHSITTTELNADEIFGSSAIIGAIEAGIVTAGTLVANETFITQLTASTAFLNKLFANSAFLQKLQVSAAPRVATLPSTPVVGQSVIYAGVDPNEYLQWTGKGINPTQRRYAASKSGPSVAIEDLSDDHALNVTVKAALTQATTPTLANQQPLVGKPSVKIARTGKNVLSPFEATTNQGVTLAVAADGTITLNGTCTAAAGSPAIFRAEMGFYLNGQYTFAMNNAVAHGSDLQMRLMQDVDAQVSSPFTNISASGANAKATFTLVNQYVWGYAIRVEGGVTYNNVVIRPQLEAVATATAYEPYNGSEATLTPSAPLYGVDGAEDEIGTDGRETHKTKYLRINGAENWQMHGTQPTLGTLARFYLPVSDIKPNALGISSAFGWIMGPGAHTASEGIGCHSSVQQINVFVMKSRVAGNSSAYPESGSNADKVAWFKALMAYYKPEAVYELAAPATPGGVAPVPMNGVDGTNIVTSDGSSVVVEYTGSGWAAVGAVQRVAVESVSITPEEGLRIDTILSNGSVSVPLYFNARGTQIGLYRVSDNMQLWGGRLLPDGRVVTVTGALQDPDVPDYDVSMLYEERIDGEMRDCDFGMALKHLEQEIARLTERVEYRFGDEEHSAVLDGRGNELYLESASVRDALGTIMSGAKIQVDPYGFVRISVRESASDTDVNMVVFAPGYCDMYMNMLPGSDNSYSCGNIDQRWTKLWAASGSIGTSDAREKHDIRPADTEMLRKFLMALDVSWFRLNALPKEQMVGFVAQQFRQAMSNAGMPDDFGGYVDEKPDHSRLGIRYEQVIAPLVSVVQQQQRRLDEQDQQIRERDGVIEEQGRQIEELTRRLDELAGRLEVIA